LADQNPDILCRPSGFKFLRTSAVSAICGTAEGETNFPHQLWSNPARNKDLRIRFYLLSELFFLSLHCIARRLVYFYHVFYYL